MPINFFMKKETDNSRIQIAAQAMQGLLASQDPEKGWNLDTLSILSFKIADNLIHHSNLEKLPELVSTPTKDSK